MQEIQSELGKANKKLISDRASEKLLVSIRHKQQVKLKNLRSLADNLLKVRTLFQTAAQRTQEQLQYHIGGLVSSALAAIWEDAYEFKLEFVERRNKTEAELWVMREDEKMKPLDAVGGGVVDVISLALRIAFWSLTKTTRPLLILDEPLKQLSKDKAELAMEMLQMLSKKLKMQILMVSHNEEFISGADKQFKVQLVKGISEIAKI